MNSLPVPEPGAVLGYAYLWSHEADQGQEEGRKNRPCAVLLAIAGTDGRAPRVAVLPITSSPPAAPGDAFEIAAATRARLGLNEAPCWVVITEANLFRWPGPDLRRLGRSGDASVLLGHLPKRFFDSIVAAVRKRNAEGRVRTITRTE